KRHGRCAAAFTAASSDALDNNAFGLPAFCGDVPLVRYGNRTRVACTTAFAANRYRCRERDLVRGQANGGADGRPAIAAASSDTLHHHAARTVARRRNGGAASRLDSSAMAAGSASAANSNGCEAKGDCRAVAPDRKSTRLNSS